MTNFSFKNKKTDSLTGLFDRQVIIEYAHHLIENNIPFSIALMDIDNFKNVNDSYGHSSGDIVIKAIAEKLKETLRDIAAVGRFGGDEFFIIFKDIVDYDAIWTACRTLTQAVNGIKIPELPNCFITCTLGLSRFPVDGSSYDELIEKTDKALYRGKIKGRSCFIIYLHEKHKDINLHSSNDKISSTTQRITTLFRLFNQSGDILSGIKAVLEHFSSTMMIDYLAVQSEKKIVSQEIYPLLENANFSYIDTSFINEIINPIQGIIHMNDLKQLDKLHRDDIKKSFADQKIKSAAYAEIAYNGKVYGYLRADSSTHQRIWQHDDLELLVTAANMIATALHYQNKDLDSLE